jgi:hypothetical protein
MAEITEIKRPENKFPIDLENAPKITLAGMEFPIPKLGWRHNRIIEPLWSQIAAQYSTLAHAWVRIAEAARVAEAAGTKVDLGEKVLEQFPEIPEELVDKLATIVHTAITRSNPGFSRGEFDGMPFGTMELCNAIPTILGQTGFYVYTPAGGASPKGEALAGQ